jgi:hypothetical protein
MANPLQQAAIRRKVIYIAIIIGLFTLSLFWRGKFTVPFGNPARSAEDARTGLNRWADRLARQSVASLASRLELRELDQGDPEVAASAARLSLLGTRGFVVTGLWWAANDKQKRNEWHELEFLVKLVTRLQPNFITPWIFQSWNLAYNVSVENDKLGDMYYYIARGIELLAEGDRLNTKRYVAADGEERMIGSPDMRFQIGFYYQNKFGVSDKVQTLRSLAQLSVIPPEKRNPETLRRPEPKPDPSEPDRLIVIPWAQHEPWVEFCKANPQLLWRLRNKLNLHNPEQIIQFLRDNFKIPTRYTLSGELAPATEQFPCLPPPFPEGQDEYDPTNRKVPDDTYDPFHAARAWFSYSQIVVPPPKTGPAGTSFAGQPIPWATPTPKVDFDEFKYRLPRSPAYIIFCQYPARAQTYLAERLGKEGWFDETSRWAPDARANPSDYWLKVSDSDPDVFLKTHTSSQAEYQKAYTRWQEFGERHAMQLKLSDLLNLERLGQRVPGNPNSLPPELSEQELNSLGLTQENLIARKATVYYRQNRSMTNFPYFLATTEAEQAEITIAARKKLWAAEQAAENAQNSLAIRDYIEGLSLWRKALLNFPQFHRPERSETTEESTYEFQVKLVDLLRDDGEVRRRTRTVAEASRCLFPGLAELAEDDFLQVVAEDEALTRIAMVSAQENEKFLARTRLLAKERAEPVIAAAIAELGADASKDPAKSQALRDSILQRVASDPQLVRSVLEREFSWMKEYKSELRDDPWVRDEVKEVVLSRLGRIRRPAGGSEDASGAEPSDDQASN